MKFKELVTKTLSQLERHVYGPLSEDIERLHEQVDMWADVPLKKRVKDLEQAVDLMGVLVAKLTIESIDELAGDFSPVEEDDDDDGFVSLELDDLDHDIAVLRVGNHQQCILDQEELDALCDIVLDYCSTTIPLGQGEVHRV